MTFHPEPFLPRPIRVLDPLEADGWQLKRYVVTLPGEALEAAASAEISATVLAALPLPARTCERPGIGFLIHHQGRGMHHAVLAWWERENELFTRVWLRPRGSAEGWEAATSGETACVWDLQIFSRERDAYVETMLAPGGPRAEAYLARTAEDQV